MAYRYYVVFEGEKVGVFDNWEVVESLVKGFSGAKYKGFNNLQQANEALEIYLEKKLPAIVRYQNNVV